MTTKIKQNNINNNFDTDIILTYAEVFWGYEIYELSGALSLKIKITSLLVEGYSKNKRKEFRKVYKEENIVYPKDNEISFDNFSLLITPVLIDVNNNTVEVWF